VKSQFELIFFLAFCFANVENAWNERENLVKVEVESGITAPIESQASHYALVCLKQL